MENAAHWGGCVIHRRGKTTKPLSPIHILLCVAIHRGLRFDSHLERFFPFPLALFHLQPPLPLLPPPLFPRFLCCYFPGGRWGACSTRAGAATHLRGAFFFLRMTAEWRQTDSGSEWKGPRHLIAFLPGKSGWQKERERGIVGTWWGFMADIKTAK